MWDYNKFILYPVNITKPNLDFAKILVTAIGGYSGELAAAMRYLNQRDTMPTAEGKALLTDIGTEELAHVEILSVMLKQLTKGVSLDEIKKSKFLGSYIEHKKSYFPTNVDGNPYTVDYYASTGDYIADLYEDLAAEMKAKAVYESLMDVTDDPEILGPLSFLRQREIIHFNRFKDLLNKYESGNLK